MWRRGCTLIACICLSYRILQKRSGASVFFAFSIVFFLFYGFSSIIRRRPRDKTTPRRMRSTVKDLCTIAQRHSSCNFFARHASDVTRIRVVARGHGDPVTRTASTTTAQRICTRTENRLLCVFSYTLTHTYINVYT